MATSRNKDSYGEHGDRKDESAHIVGRRDIKGGLLSLNFS